MKKKLFLFLLATMIIPLIFTVIKAKNVKAVGLVIRKAAEQIYSPEYISIQYLAPFVSQAPTGNWNDSVFKDACEETSLIMAEGWIVNPNLVPEDVEKQLHDVAAWEVARFGFHQDTSVTDTFIMATEYFHLPTILYQNINTNDIKIALQNKNVVIVPIDASKLYENSNTVRHMVLVTGFDSNTDQFTFSDPMQANGGGLRVDEMILAAALRDYPSGVHKKVTEQKTGMITVGWPWLSAPN